MTECFLCPPLGALNITSWEPSLSHTFWFDILSRSHTQCSVVLCSAFEWFLLCFVNCYSIFFFRSSNDTVFQWWVTGRCPTQHTHTHPQSPLGLFKNQRHSVYVACLFITPESSMGVRTSFRKQIHNTSLLWDRQRARDSLPCDSEIVAQCVFYRGHKSKLTQVKWHITCANAAQVILYTFDLRSVTLV